MNQRNLFLACLIPLLGWWAYGLFDLDEGFYGAVTTDMNLRGEWITPTLNGSPWYEKPILLYWLAKPCLMIWHSTFMARLPSILATIGVFWLVLWFAKNHLDRLALRPIRSGHAALFVLATSLLFVGVGRMMMTDMILNFCLTAAIFGFWHGLTRDARAWAWAGAALGASVLAKGPVGIILFVPLAWYGFRLNRRSGEPRPANENRFLWAGLGGLAMIAVTASWYLPAYLKDGDVFVQKFLIEQNLNRFTGGDTAHTVRGISGLVYYIPILMIGMAPWSWFIKRSWPRLGADPALKFIAAFAFVPFLFFTLSSAKLVHYILPCFAPLALLIGHHLAGVWGKWPKWTWGWLGATAVLVNGGLIAWYYLSGHAEVHAFAASVRDESTPVIAYQLPRREKDLGTGKPKIQEQSHPSLEFVLGRPFFEAETLEDIAKVPRPAYLLTRWNRIQDGDWAKLDALGIEIVPTKEVQNGYYRLIPIRDR